MRSPFFDIAGKPAPFLSFVVCLLWVSTAVTAADPDVGALEEQAFKEASALVDASLVRIQTVGGLDRVGQVLTGTGPTSGVIVSADGYIISSAFNFISKPASILVQLQDERRFPAEVVATDRSRMLTLLKIDAANLLVPQVTPKAEVKVGQWSLALGRTLDQTYPSLSVGIVSALDRIWGKAIQTDAKVSPVNYGGPLVDIQGRVMGILVPLSPQASEEAAGVEWYDSGIGFAVPMEDVLAAVTRLKAGKDLLPGLLGITFEGRDQLAGKPLIDRVRVESPADKAGLESGDLIVSINGRPIARQAEARQHLGARYAGDTVEIVVKRGEETLQKKVELVAELIPYESGFLGILPARSATGNAPAAGVAVRYVFPDSPAAKAGIAPRDFILKLNGGEVADAAALLALVSRLRPGEKASLTWSHEGQEKTAEVELAAVSSDIPAELASSLIPQPPAADEKPADEAATKDAAVAPKTGRITVEMKDHERSYWAFIPEGYNPDYQYGLMVWIHPGGDTMEAAVMKQWQAAAEQRGLILIGPKAGELRGWNANEAEFVKDAVANLRESYSIDPGRIFLHGFATGGEFAWQLNFKYRDLFRGIAAAAAPLRTPPPENDPDFRLQICLITGDQDELVKQVTATAGALKNMKYPVHLMTLKETGRKYPPAEQVEELARWADSLDRI